MGGVDTEVVAGLDTTATLDRLTGSEYDKLTELVVLVLTLGNCVTL